MSAARTLIMDDMIDPRLTLGPVKKSFFDTVAKGLKTEHMDFRDYLPEAWPIIEPSTAFIPNWHIDCIAEHLHAVHLGQIRDLLINVPPRSLKSVEVTVLFPTWVWSPCPWTQFMFVSYSAALSTKHSIDRRRVLESPWYLDRWGSLVSLQSDQNKTNVYENTARGVMRSTSVGGSATGFGADIQVFDDILNPKEAESKAEREKAVREFDLTFSSRLNNKKTGARIVVEQRTHAEDVSGHVLKQGGWTHLKLPAIAEQRETIIFPVTGRRVDREVGDVLNPDREPTSVLARQKTILGSRGFAAQYQQNPTSDTGNIFNRDWWRFYRKLPEGIDLGCQTWDLAFKDNETSSYVAGYMLIRRGPNVYVMPREVREHLNFPATIRAVLTFTAAYPQYAHLPKLIEDKANGPAAVATLQNKIPGIIAVPVEGSKLARASAASPIVESGNVFLPDPSVFPEAHWVHDFIEEFARFPAEPNDRVDAICQGLVRLQIAPVDHENDKQEVEEQGFVDHASASDFGEIGGGYGEGESFL